MFSYFHYLFLDIIVSNYRFKVVSAPLYECIYDIPINGNDENINKNIIDNCGDYVNIKDLNELEIFFKEEGIIASNRELYLPTFENN